MSDINQADPDIADLLPWYAAGTLSPADAARVEAALEREPGLKANLDAAHEDIELATVGNEAAGVPSLAAWARVDAVAFNEPYRPGFTARLRTACVSVFARATMAPMLAGGIAAAAALVIVAQGGALLYLGSPTGPAFHTASDPAANARGAQLLVAFDPAISVGRMAEILGSRGAIVIDGPRAGGLYRIALRADVRAVPDVEAAMAALRAEDGVRMVVGAPTR